MISKISFWWTWSKIEFSRGDTYCNLWTDIPLWPSRSGLTRSCVTNHILASLSAQIRQPPEAHRRAPSLFAPEILNELLNEFLGGIAGDVLLVHRMRDMLVVQTKIPLDNRGMVSGIQSKTESWVWAKTEVTHTLPSISEGAPPAASRWTALWTYRLPSTLPPSYHSMYLFQRIDEGRSVVFAVAVEGDECSFAGEQSML